MSFHQLYGEVRISRAERRHRRCRAVKRAFEIYWKSWDSPRDWDDFRYGRSRGFRILDGEQERRDMQDRHRADWMLNAKLWADHMRTCSCYLCSGHKKYVKSTADAREAIRTRDELDDLWSV